MCKCGMNFDGDASIGLFQRWSPCVQWCLLFHSSRIIFKVHMCKLDAKVYIVKRGIRRQSSYSILQWRGLQVVRGRGYQWVVQILHNLIIVAHECSIMCIISCPPVIPRTLAVELKEHWIAACICPIIQWEGVWTPKPPSAYVTKWWSFRQNSRWCDRCMFN